LSLDPTDITTAEGMMCFGATDFTQRRQVRTQEGRSLGISDGLHSLRSVLFLAMRDNV
jgi:hypothetical protein